MNLNDNTVAYIKSQVLKESSVNDLLGFLHMNKSLVFLIRRIMSQRRPQDYRNTWLQKGWEPLL